MYHNMSAALIVGTCAALASCDTSTPTDSIPPENPAIRPTERGSNTGLAPGDAWTAKPRLPVARYGHRAAMVNNIIYVVGGNSADGVTLSRVDAFNLATNSWSRRASLPSPRWEPNGASVIKGLIYVSGGEDAGSQRTKTLFVYDPGTDTWARRAAMPAPGSCGTQGVIGGLLYVSTGCGSSPNNVTHFYRYDPAANTWATLASPPEVQDFGVAGVVGGRFYLMGGAGDILDVYDPATNSWSRKARVLNGQPLMSIAVLNGKLFVAGGFDASTAEANPDDPLAGMLSTLRVYDPTTNAWHLRAPMPTPRDDGAGVAAGGLFFVMGGFTNSQAVARSVLAYKP